MTPSPLRLPSGRVALAASLLIGVALCFIPLTGVQGAESALGLALVLPSFVAANAASYVAAFRRSGLSEPASAVLWRTLLAGLAVAAVGAVVLALDALRVRQCAPYEGLAFMALGPGFGVALAAWIGVLSGATLRRAWLARAVAALVPVVAIVWGLAELWRSPAVFALSPFAGFFPGSIYDTDLTLPLRFVTYRGVGLLWLGALGGIIAAGWEAPRARLSARRALGRPSLAIAALACVAGSAVAFAYGPELGHRSSRAHLAEVLGAATPSRRCVLIAPRELPAVEVARLGRDCDAYVEGAERALGVAHPAPIRAYLYRSLDEKRALMGAGGTDIAKPWLDEVHLQLGPWPDAVFEHEIAHIVAGAAAPGPLRLAGRYGGLLPNPGIVEGVAVAITWESRGGLTPHQWARALLELGRLPPLSRLMSLDFTAMPPGIAYTSAGSFVRFLLDTAGARAVRTLYRAGTIDALGAPTDELDRMWRAYLANVAMPADAKALAEIRYARTSVLRAVCPHRVAVLEDRLGADLAAGDTDRALATCDAILGIDGHNLRALVHRVGALASAGRLDDARRVLASLGQDPSVPPAAVARAREVFADGAWRAGRPDEARQLYEALLQAPQTEDGARALEVKLEALRGGGEEAALVRDMLVHDPGGVVDGAVLVADADRLGRMRSDGLGPYLAARQLFARQRLQMAERALDQALSRGLPTVRLRREATRLLGLSLAGQGTPDTLEAAERVFAAHTDAPGALGVDSRRWLARLRGVPLHARPAAALTDR